MDGIVLMDALDQPREPSTLDIAKVCESERSRLLRIAAGMGLKHQDAEDALQDAFSSLLSQGLRDREAARRWLVRVLINRCLLHHRRASRWKRVLSLWRPHSPDPQKGPELLRVVRDSLDRLPGDERAALVLRYFCGFTATEVAEMLGVAGSTIRSRLVNARVALAKDLIAKGLAHDDC